MAKGPAKQDRIVSIGPLTYDETKPPEIPRDFEPPSIISNSLNQDDYWKDWDGRTPRPVQVSDKVFVGPSPSDRPVWAYGITGAYDHNNDIVVVDNREWVHHPDQTDFVAKGLSPIPEWWTLEEGLPMVWAVGFAHFRRPEGEVYIPAADIAKVDVMEGLGIGVKEVKEEWIYKAAYACKILGVPDLTRVTVRHGFRRRFEAERSVRMEDLYRELQFEGMLPETKIERNIDSDLVDFKV